MLPLTVAIYAHQLVADFIGNRHPHRDVAGRTNVLHCLCPSCFELWRAGLLALGVSAPQGLSGNSAHFCRSSPSYAGPALLLHIGGAAMGSPALCFLANILKDHSTLLLDDGDENIMGAVLIQVPLNKP